MSSIRSPSIQTSRPSSRSPARNCAPVRAPVAPRSRRRPSHVPSRIVVTSVRRSARELRCAPSAVEAAAGQRLLGVEAREELLEGALAARGEGDRAAPARRPRGRAARPGRAARACRSRPRRSAARRPCASASSRVSCGPQTQRQKSIVKLDQVRPSACSAPRLEPRAQGRGGAEDVLHDEHRRRRRARCRPCAPGRRPPRAGARSGGRPLGA